ncbi:MAG: hypothetical protein R2730_14745 [Chitinophagales bacterium]
MFIFDGSSKDKDTYIQKEIESGMFINLKKVYQLDISSQENELLQKAKDNPTQLTTLVFIDQLIQGSDQEALLLKILGAVDLKENNYVFISRTDHPHLCLGHFDQTLFTNLKYIIVFGLKANDVGLHTISKKYLNMTVGDKHILFSDNLAALQQQSALKGELWNSLKRMFEMG